MFVRPAQAIDLIPGDATAPPKDLGLLQLSYQESRRGDFFVDGRDRLKGANLLNQQVQVRLGHSLNFGDTHGFVYAETPITSVAPGGILANRPGDSGVGDTTVMLAFWPYADPFRKTYFAIGSYLLLPTGTYDPRRVPFNVGGNRYAGALQAAYQTAFGDHLDWMAVLDGAWFGTNDDYIAEGRRLDQRPLFSGQTGFRYRIDSQYGFTANYIYSWGGETRINGRAQNDELRFERYQLTAFGHYSFGRLSLQYGRDFYTENGFIEKERWAIRYLKLF